VRLRQTGCRSARLRQGASGRRRMIEEEMMTLVKALGYLLTGLNESG
jgi:hypothetical protein